MNLDNQSLTKVVVSLLPVHKSLQTPLDIVLDFLQTVFQLYSECHMDALLKRYVQISVAIIFYRSHSSSR